MTDALKDTPDTSSRSFGWGWLWWLPVAVLLYYLSIGPAVFLVQRGFIARGSQTFQALVAFYTPLEAIDRRAPLIHKLLGMYLHLWAPERFDSKGNPK
jgi:hypothetical protein